MSKQKTHTMWMRKQVEINTDPQRRCYNGCHFSSEMVWTEWQDLFDVSDEEDAKLTMANFKSINPDREYCLTKIGEKPCQPK